MYQRKTNNVVVRVEPEFLDEQSSPADDRFIWAYTVEIENTGAEDVQIVERHWQITDRNGLTQEVHGEGVVGEKPKLRPGETFRYTSGAPLNAPSGVMLGSYQMQTGKGDKFDVEIPAFSLDSPFEPRSIN
ncbi:MAG TPA: Co2+/Mg2+ efflux protein ApaG [Hellea balneolensis]|uniref:Protein ApaG n=1 Tax=Hellea balneolensis TaxID=287478 RepID=A0A7V5NWN7_9PROT|nr:Co2+/Mg2+ efflux protein ApaG [Hellea balneolensis]